MKDLKEFKKKIFFFSRSFFLVSINDNDRELLGFFLSNLKQLTVNIGYITVILVSISCYILLQKITFACCNVYGKSFYLLLNKNKIEISVRIFPIYLWLNLLNNNQNIYLDLH